MADQQYTAKTVTRRVIHRASGATSASPPPSTPTTTAGGGGRGRRASVGATAGAVPLALALIAGSVLPGSNGQPSAAAVQHGVAAVKCDSVDDMHACHVDYPTGCNASGKYDPYLNLLKNKLTLPAVVAQDPVLDMSSFDDLNKNTPQQLSKSNHGQFKDDLAKLGEGKQRVLIGYLYYAKLSGAESSNCGLSGPEDVDYHIGIGFAPDLAARIAQKKLSPQDKKDLTHSSVIVEMTPHYRGAFEPSWSVDDLLKVVGHQVKVTGQLIIDSEHNNGAQNCGFAGGSQATCWRASAWELHPVTKLEVCTKNGGACDVNDNNWVALENMISSGG